jgi:hypothetical protein
MVVQVQVHSTARPDEDMNPRPNPKFKPKTLPTAAASNRPSQAPENLRNVTDAADREDQELKIRSLGRGRREGDEYTSIVEQSRCGPLAGTRTTEGGIADLVSKKQVQYTQTIARLHPDKVCFAFCGCQHGVNGFIFVVKYK